MLLVPSSGLVEIGWSYQFSKPTRCPRRVWASTNFGSEGHGYFGPALQATTGGLSIAASVSGDRDLAEALRVAHFANNAWGLGGHQLATYVRDAWHDSHAPGGQYEPAETYIVNGDDSSATLMGTGTGSTGRSRVDDADFEQWLLEMESTPSDQMDESYLLAANDGAGSGWYPTAQRPPRRPSHPYDPYIDGKLFRDPGMGDPLYTPWFENSEYAGTEFVRLSCLCWNWNWGSVGLA